MNLHACCLTCLAGFRKMLVHNCSTFQKGNNYSHNNNEKNQVLREYEYKKTRLVKIQALFFSRKRANYCYKLRSLFMVRNNKKKQLKIQLTMFIIAFME